MPLAPDSRGKGLSGSGRAVNGVDLIAIMRILIGFTALFLFFSPPPAFASVFVPDLRVGLLGRSYPVGAQLVGSAGLGARIWGRTDQWKYGYARLAFNGATSVVVNRAGVEVQLFPVSILGVSAGYESGVRNFRPRFLDCNAVECEGRVDRAYLRGQLFFGVKGVVLNWNVRYEQLRAYRSERPFFDEMTLLRGRSAGEVVIQHNPILLYRVSPEWKVGATSLYSRALDSGGYSHMYGPLVAWSDPVKWSVAGGIGINQSPLFAPGFTVFFMAQMAIAPSLQISDLAFRNFANRAGTGARSKPE